MKLQLITRVLHATACQSINVLRSPETFSCVAPLKNGIRPQDKKGVLRMGAALNSARTLTIAGLLSLGTVFFANAQSPANGSNALAMNDKPKTEVSNNTKAPVIIRSSSWDAQNYSIDKNALVVHIATGNKEKMYTAEEYATMLSEMFLDPTRTKNPTKVVFFIEETNDDFGAACRIYINGHNYDKNGGQLKDGDDFIHPYDVPGHIPTITQKYADAKSKSNTVSVGYTND